MTSKLIKLYDEREAYIENKILRVGSEWFEMPTYKRNKKAETVASAF